LSEASGQLLHSLAVKIPVMADRVIKVSSMNLTTKPITIAEHTSFRPEFIRLPKPGTSDPWTSLSRSTLNVLVLPYRDNGFKPTVRSFALRRRGNQRGVRLVDLQILIDYINAHVEPAYIAHKPQELNTPRNPENTFVQKVGLNDTLRVIISLRLEKESAFAEGTNGSS
jgi:hypothetical protein